MIERYRLPTYSPTPIVHLRTAQLKKGTGVDSLKPLCHGLLLPLSLRLYISTYLLQLITANKNGLFPAELLLGVLSTP